MNRSFIGAFALGSFALILGLQNLSGQTKAEKKPATAPTQSAKDKKKSPEKSGDQVIDDLLKKAKPKSSTDPDARRPVRPVTVDKTNADKRIRGTAPGLTEPQLQTEGQFVISRRGKVLLGKKGALPVFLFAGDGKKSPEPPMILMPCRQVEMAETLVGSGGERINFMITGQVFKYRGANYLLPSMLRPVIDRGNLKP